MKNRNSGKGLSCSVSPGHICTSEVNVAVVDKGIVGGGSIFQEGSLTGIDRVPLEVLQSA